MWKDIIMIDYEKVVIRYMQMTASQGSNRNMIQFTYNQYSEKMVALKHSERDSLMYILIY